MAWLVSWIGDNDIRGMRGLAEQGAGPIADFLQTRSFERALLLHNRPTEAADYQVWLQMTLRLRADVMGVDLPRPQDFDDVYDKTILALDRFATRIEEFRDAPKAYLLSPGTKAMSTALMLIGCTTHRGELHVNWIEKSVPDPAHRAARVRWPERFTLALWPLHQEAGGQLETLVDTEGREVTRSRVVLAVYDQARRVGVTDTSVLIMGETGTGKELLARFVHRSSARHARGFVPVNCGAIPPTLIDSQLFGHARGAFTDARTEGEGFVGVAAAGTLFLDEIGELPLETQSRLLRLLQDGEYYRVGEHQPRKADVRVVAATHRDLRQLVRSGQFRPDLYFRLAQYTLRLPPLRQRPEDFDLLCAEVMQRESARTGLTWIIDEGAWRVLRAYPWPGNVREFFGILGRCLVDARAGIARERVIDRSVVAHALEEQGLGPVASDAQEPGDLPNTLLTQLQASERGYREWIHALEADVIGRAIRNARSLADAARGLGMSPQALHNKRATLRKRGLSV